MRPWVDHLDLPAAFIGTLRNLRGRSTLIIGNPGKRILDELTTDPDLLHMIPWPGPPGLFTASAFENIFSSTGLKPGGRFEAVLLAPDAPVDSLIHYALGFSKDFLDDRGTLALLGFTGSAVNDAQRNFRGLNDCLIRLLFSQEYKSEYLETEALVSLFRAYGFHHIRQTVLRGKELGLSNSNRSELRTEGSRRIAELLEQLARAETADDGTIPTEPAALLNRIEIHGIEPPALCLIAGIKKESDRPKKIPATETPIPEKADIRISEASSPELLSLIFSSGESSPRWDSVARRILSEYGSRDIVETRDPRILSEKPGISYSKAVQVAAIFELGKRFWGKDDAQGIGALRDARDVFRYTQEMTNLRNEQFRGLYLNSQYRLIRDTVLSEGDTGEIRLLPDKMIDEGKTAGAGKIIVVHNHPSGDPAPSPEDVEMTRTLKSAAERHALELIDHVIISKGGWFSFRQERLL